MMARGDLGLATSPERVPIAQKRIVQAARTAGKPVIVATQMLESMLASPQPTRAEASDVANAVFDSVDAVMLSGETAIGRYPVESVSMMARIASMAETSGFRDMPTEPGTGPDVPHAVSAAVCDLAGRLDLAAIVTATQSGATARSVAAHRPGTPIVAVTGDAEFARRLALVWGVTPVVGGQPSGVDELIETAAEAARGAGCTSGDLVAITAGVAIGQAGGTDLIQVRRV
jgi:pyruvate kinase